MRQRVFIMIGFPGSGKSTAAREIAKKTGAVILDKDKIRTMLYGKYDWKKQDEELIESTVLHLFRSFLVMGKDIVFDDPHLTKTERLKMVMISKQLGKDPEIIFIWCTSNDALDKRIENNRGVEPERWIKVYTDMENKFERPTQKEIYLLEAKLKKIDTTNNLVKVG